MDDMTKNPDFDPFSQSFTLLLPDGQTPFNISLPQLDQFVTQHSQICINYGSQIGASLVMLLVVVLTTRESKRRSPIFVINVLSLIFALIRGIILTTYWVGAYSESYAWFAGDFDKVTSTDIANSVATPIVSWLLMAAVEVSLTLQTNVVCVTMGTKLRLAMMSFSILLVTAALAVRFAAMVLNIEAILNYSSQFDITGISSASLILQTCTIWYFSAIFIAKLGWTIYQRKKMNMKQWGPMQIICIMSGCTMIIPSIFAILEYYPDCFPEAGSLALTMIAIFLPLSSLWAAASIDSTNPLHQVSTDPTHRRPADTTESSSAPMLSSCSNCRKTSVCTSPTNASAETEPGMFGGMSMSLGMGRGRDREWNEDAVPGMVRIQRTISVRSNHEECTGMKGEGEC